MILTPSKVKRNRIVKNLTLNFETVSKIRGNLVFIQSTKREDLTAVLKSRLFRPQQLMAVYMPRIIRPMNRKTVRIDQKTMYQEIKADTSNKIKIARIGLTSYAGRNLVYDIRPEWNETYKIASSIKQRIGLQTYMTKYQEDLIANVTRDVNYEKNYIVFPLVAYIPNFRKSVYTVSQTDLPPVSMFLKSIKNKTIDISAYNGISEIFFYNPNASAVVVMNLRELGSDFDSYFVKINRLNNFNNGDDALDDDVDIISTSDLDEDDLIENNKQKIKDAIFKNVAKKLKVQNLDDFEPSTKDEEELIQKIDRSIDEFIANPDNAEKSVGDLVSNIENQPDIKAKALAFVEGKRIAAQKLTQLSKGIDKEFEVLEKISDTTIDDMVSDENVLEAAKLPVEGIPEPVKTSKLASLDSEYNKKLYKKDFNEVLTAFTSSDYIPMTIDNIEVIDTSDDFNEKETYKLKYKTDDGKTLSFAIDVPKIIDDRYLYLGGNKKMITKQMIRLPIVKTKADRVEITSNFNKITVERTSGKISRKNAYLIKILNRYKGSNTVTVTYGQNSIMNAEYTNDFEYEEIADSVSRIETFRYTVDFNRKQIEEDINMMDFPENVISENMTPFATVNGENVFYYISSNDRHIYEARMDGGYQTKLVAEDMFSFITQAVLGLSESEKLPTIGKSFVYTKMYIFGCGYPLFSVVGMMVGLSSVLKRYGVKHMVSDTKIKDPNYVEVVFKDKYFYYEDNPKNTLLLNVLYLMNPENYDFKDFDLSEPYIDFFRDKLGQPQYIKNTLRLNLNVFLDPITKNVLHDLKQPENMIDVLLYANTLLMNNSYRYQNDIRNCRIRGNELINAILYSLLADGYMNYQRGKMNGKSVDSIKLGFSLNGKEISGSNALITKLLTQPNINDMSLLSPIVVADGIGATSMRGHKGVNLGSAYTLELRAYDDSMNGVLSGNSTAFSGSVGITRSLSLNPNITSPRGYIGDIQDIKKLNGIDRYAVVELLSPWTATHADPPRQAMQVSQTKHTMPVARSDKQLVGSGVNKILPHMLPDDFCFKAKHDGIIDKIDNEAQLCFLLYDNGTHEAIDISSTFMKNSSSGFFLRQNLKLVYGEKEKFKKGEILAYNPAFFTGKGNDVDYSPGVLAKIAITPGDFAYEDSGLITDKLASKLETKVSMLKAVALGPNSIIHHIAEVGDKIVTGDHLLDFTTSFNDPDTTEFLANLNQQLGVDDAEALGNDAITTKYTGVVGDIKIYYNVPLETLSKSLQDLIQKYSSKIERRKQILKANNANNIKIPPLIQQKGNKVGTTEYEGVLIEFYLEYVDEMNSGSKGTFTTALKFVTSRRLTNDEAPISEYDKNNIIEAILSSTGIISRMTLDIFAILYSNKVLIELRDQIVDIVKS